MLDCTVSKKYSRSSFSSTRNDEPRLVEIRNVRCVESDGTDSNGI